MRRQSSTPQWRATRLCALLGAWLFTGLMILNVGNMLSMGSLPEITWPHPGAAGVRLRASAEPPGGGEEKRKLALREVPESPSAPVRKLTVGSDLAQSVTPQSGPARKLGKCFEALPNGTLSADEQRVLVMRLLEDPDRTPPRPLVYLQLPGHEIVEDKLRNAWDNQGCRAITVGQKASDVTLRGAAGKDCFHLRVDSSSIDEALAPFSGSGTGGGPPLESLVGLYGLVPFGACRYFGDACRYTTVLADPVKSFVAHAHRECRESPDLYGDACASLERFVAMVEEGGGARFDATQTRRIAGDGDNPPARPCADSGLCDDISFTRADVGDLSLALWNLIRYFPLVGVEEGAGIGDYTSKLRQFYAYIFLEEVDGEKEMRRKRLRSAAARGKKLGITADAADHLPRHLQTKIEKIVGVDAALHDFVSCVIRTNAWRFGD